MNLFVYKTPGEGQTQNTNTNTNSKYKHKCKIQNTCRRTNSKYKYKLKHLGPHCLILLFIISMFTTITITITIAIITITTIIIVITIITITLSPSISRPPKTGLQLLPGHMTAVHHCHKVVSAPLLPVSQALQNIIIIMIIIW